MEIQGFESFNLEITKPDIQFRAFRNSKVPHSGIWKFGHWIFGKLTIRNFRNLGEPETGTWGNQCGAGWGNEWGQYGARIL